jgi:hypothetical protein
MLVPVVFAFRNGAQHCQAALGWDPASPTLGVHVRRGDACAHWRNGRMHHAGCDLPRAAAREKVGPASGTARRCGAEQQRDGESERERWFLFSPRARAELMPEAFCVDLDAHVLPAVDVMATVAPPPAPSQAAGR